MIIEGYIKELEAKKLSKYTIKNYSLVLRTLNKFKPLDTIEKKDLIEFFRAFNGEDSSLNLYQITIKKYFKDMKRPDLIDWITPTKIKEKLRSDDILTPDEINCMIEATNSHYWKALIAFLFETGARISEASLIKYKDIQDTDQGMIVNIPTSKTNAGYRKVILPFSSQYIRNLKTYTAKNKEDIVFSLKHTITGVTISNIAKKAGITKTVSPHRFRHAQATDMVKRSYNEAIIRKKLGWTPTSNMIARYQHLNDEDVINATLENTGKLPQTTAPRTEIKEANKLSLVDAAMQFSKLTEENEFMKSQIAEMELKINDIIRAAVGQGVFDIPGQKESIVEKEVAVMKKQFEIKT